MLILASLSTQSPTLRIGCTVGTECLCGNGCEDICWSCVQFCLSSVINRIQPSLKPLFIKTSPLQDSFCATCCLNLKKEVTLFSIKHFTWWLKRACLHNGYYAICQINNTLVEGKITKPWRFNSADLASKAESLWKSHAIPNLHYNYQHHLSTQDPIRNSAPLRVHKGQPCKICNLLPLHHSKEIDTSLKKKTKNQYGRSYPYKAGLWFEQLLGVLGWFC